MVVKYPTLITCAYCDCNYSQPDSDASQSYKFCSQWCQEQDIRRNLGMSHGFYYQEDEEC